MRDKLIHDYFGVDIEKVWDTAKDDLPILRKQVVRTQRRRTITITNKKRSFSRAFFVATNLFQSQKG